MKQLFFSSTKRREERNFVKEKQIQQQKGVPVFKVHLSRRCLRQDHIQSLLRWTCMKTIEAPTSGKLSRERERENSNLKTLIL